MTISTQEDTLVESLRHRHNLRSSLQKRAHSLQVRWLWRPSLHRAPSQTARAGEKFHVLPPRAMTGFEASRCLYMLYQEQRITSKGAT